MHQFNNKKGIELPISMVVVLILSIVVFSFGIVMVFKFFKGATEASTTIDRQTQEHITRILRESNDLVALPNSYTEARIGSNIQTAIGIRNIHDTTTFAVSLGFDGAYLSNDEQIQTTDKNFIEEQWLGNFMYHTNIRIEQDQFITLPMSIHIGDSINDQQKTPKGTYVFNVCVFPEQPTECLNTFSTKETTYDKKIRQITIKVV